MALANKNHNMPNEPTNPIIQPSPFHQHNVAYKEPETPEKAKNFAMSNSSSVSSPSSTISNFNHLSEESNSVISFKPEYGNFACGPFLSFDQQGKSLQKNIFSKMIEEGGDEEEEYPVWDQELHYHNAQFAWMNGEVANAITGGVHDLGSNNKRPSTGANVQALKKQCGVGDSKKARSKSASTSNDPQSVAAKNRRERISERLKILQDLVPNGSKVDLVTMLEKAIGYVKFLQLQVKVLATDDFWPAQGGKAPDLSQVREAIDSILASQRDRNSSSEQRQE